MEWRSGQPEVEDARCQIPLGWARRPQVFTAAAGRNRSWIRVPAALGDKKTREQDKAAKAGLQHLVGDRF
jgi:hypothetical protein